MTHARATKIAPVTFSRCATSQWPSHFREQTNTHLYDRPSLSMIHHLTLINTFNYHFISFYFGPHFLLFLFCFPFTKFIILSPPKYINQVLKFQLKIIPSISLIYLLLFLNFIYRFVYFIFFGLFINDELLLKCNIANNETAFKLSVFEAKS